MKKPVPFGKYYLLERINVGGMAEVFRSKAYGVEGFERLVAVKRILPNIAEDKEFIKMFIDEAKIAVQLNHANIAQIFDLGVVDSSYYIALEHVHGRDLRNIFDRCRTANEPMPVAQACFVIMKICEGLDYAHNKRDQGGRDLNLVHRDVSPQNILVSFEGEVKLIDFGIAKAAGKGQKTQAGILKGKFGYMSPEQVRGLPLDRKSDIFSCGIVLYELLTGERLFVGESDFSTLEKVRNVEILPPSTYNRKIPDELERIVLKALAKDTEDRYQNAIDLHDELQAFVYTAGEFYSRKDLAAWMKKTFGKEIEEETAKLETYRQLKPPPELLAGGRGPAAAPAQVNKPPAVPPGARRTTSMPSVPPPTPGTGGAPVTRPPPPPSGLRSTQGMPVVPPPPSMTMPSMSAAANAAAGDYGPPKADLNWDDDELETQIYDNPEEEAAAKAAKANAVMSSAVAAMAAATPGMLPPPPPAPPPPVEEPDLSALVRTAKGWGATGAKANGHPPGTNGHVAAAPAFTAGAGSGPMSAVGPNTGAGPATPYFEDRHESAASFPHARPDSFDPMATFGAGIVAPKKSRTMLWAALGGVALIAAAVAIVLITSRSNKKTPEATAGTDTPTAGTAAPAPGDANTGFDLFVSPASVTGWRIDDKPQSTTLPAQIRQVATGRHRVSIDAPPGFMSVSQDVEVTAGQVERVTITLQPLEIVASFETTPPGAKVVLVADGKRTEVGVTPTNAKIDPRQRYDVEFEKDGYVSVTKPLVISGAPEEKVVVNLERGGTVAVAPGSGSSGPATMPGGGSSKPSGGSAKPPGGGSSKPPGGDVKPPGGDVKPPGGDVKPPGGDVKPPGGDVKPPPVAKGDGTLLLSAKPPCEIFVDGRNTGLKTPQRDLKLSAGKHKITLLNNEFGIKESFSVDIKADEQTKAIKDFSDRLPQ
ncbi:MAG: serine/threonine protein kinase [Myxococcales bacterium]|nr:serine/threonine protein kinase [Myxococcales bacterium]